MADSRGQARDVPPPHIQQWRIYIVKFWMHAPLGVQILSISCSFGENLAKLYVGAPGRLAPPPPGNPGSASANGIHDHHIAPVKTGQEKDNVQRRPCRTYLFLAHLPSFWIYHWTTPLFQTAALVSHNHLYFLQNVVGLTGSLAGYLLFIGQTADAACTPLVGYFSDKSSGCYKFGRRKCWHAFGKFTHR